LFSLNTLFDLVELSIGLRLHSLGVDGVLDILNLLFSHLGLNHSLHFDIFNLGLRLGLDPLLFACSFGLLLSDLHLLGGDLELGLLRLDVLVVSLQGFRNVRLGDSDGNNLDSRSPVVAIFL
jgi:hypothetical protein